ncbi:hypothetical protein XELAEV_18003015mg, partial [Xenopus laevis]
MAPGGTAGQLLALTLWLGLLTWISDCHLGLQLLPAGNCIDSSWIHPSQWTPSAPSNLEVVLVVEANESGDPVPVFRISWTVAPY